MASSISAFSRSNSTTARRTETITHGHAQPFEQRLLDEHLPGAQHLRQGASGRQLDRTVEGPARFDDLEIREQGAVFAGAPHDGIELVGARRRVCAVGHCRDNRRIHCWLKGEVRLHRDVGGDQAAGIAGECAVDAVAKTAQRHQRHHRQRDAQHKDGRLAARRPQLRRMKVE